MNFIHVDHASHTGDGIPDSDAVHKYDFKLHASEGVQLP